MAFVGTGFLIQAFLIVAHVAVIGFVDDHVWELQKLMAAVASLQSFLLFSFLLASHPTNQKPNVLVRVLGGS